MKGRTIRISLVDGVPSGVLTAGIVNGAGKVIVAPRTQLPELAQREEAKRAGVYCLVGPNPQSPSRGLVYIGESDNALKRILQQDKDERKDFWNRAVLVISKDENLTKSHVRFLESRLIALALAAGRASLTNDTNPEPANLPEPDVADMEFFLEQVQMVLPVLGFTFTQPQPVVDAPGSNGAATASPMFILEDAGTHARAREIDGEFIVLKGSTARKQGVDSWTSYHGLRDQLVADKKLVPSNEPDYYVFAEDVPFSSPSAGAAVVAARNQNGRERWRVEATGQTYLQWHESRLVNAGESRTLGMAEASV